MGFQSLGPVWLMVLFLAVGVAGAQEPATPEPIMSPAEVDAAPSPAEAAMAVPESVAPPPRTLTLWDMMMSGGVILWIIVAMSVVTLVLMVYYLFTVTPAREVPAGFVKRAYAQIRAGDVRGAYQMCEGRDELLPSVLRAGLRMSNHDRYVIQEAMESEGERGATALWQKISYLSNVATLAPLLGLLGTVWGMIQAFGAIAFDDSQVKGLRMAEGVAQAMITTAAGLMLAIPAMLVYFYLRGRVTRIVAEVEAEASEFVELLARRREE